MSDHSSDSTRERIVSSATTEFALRGVAGSRVDRIAKSARTSKERVYAYFRGKEDLYREVLARELSAIAEATRLDPTDLPGYAGRVHDYFVAHPDRRLLMRWGQLEFARSVPSAAAQESISAKVEALRRAQQEGALDSMWDPLDVLVFVNQLATAWVDQPGQLSPAGDSRATNDLLDQRREAIIAAVERLFPRTAPAEK